MRVEDNEEMNYLKHEIEKLRKKLDNITYHKQRYKEMLPDDITYDHCVVCGEKWLGDDLQSDYCDGCEKTHKGIQVVNKITDSIYMIYIVYHGNHGNYDTITNIIKEKLLLEKTVKIPESWVKVSSSLKDYLSFYSDKQLQALFDSDYMMIEDLETYDGLNGCLLKEIVAGELFQVVSTPKRLITTPIKLRKLIIFTNKEPQNLFKGEYGLQNRICIISIDDMCTLTGINSKL